MIVVGLLTGLVVGAAVVYAWWQKSSRDQALLVQGLQKDVVVANEAAQRAELAHEEFRQRVEEDRQRTFDGLEAQFTTISQKVLDTTVTRFEQNQASVTKAREETLTAKIDGKFDPLKTMLSAYEENLKNFDEAHRDALAAVQQKADQLLQTQIENQKATTKLNQILGRSDTRGRWGEVQLANVLQASNLTEGLDFRLQQSKAGSTGERHIPDCIINLPNQGHVVVDAKFPFDKFEQSISTTDLDEANKLRGEHAQALRQHVKALTSKSYWETLPFTPRFTVCFIPSDAALTAAFDADPQLFEYANQQSVLIAGPTNLLSLLWSASMVLREYQQNQNTEKILVEASKLPDLIRNVASPIQKMGKALEQAGKEFNGLVASVESRLIPASRRIQELGTARSAQPIADIPMITEGIRQLDEAKWDVDPSSDDLARQSEIIDIDENGQFE